MRCPFLALLKSAAVILLAAAITFAPAELWGQEDTLQVQGLKSFRITPKRQASYHWIGAVYNPNLDRYVMLFNDYKNEPPYGPVQTIYSRMFNHKGKKAGPLINVVTLSGGEEYAPFFDMAMNEIENEILVVFCQGNYDQIFGVPLSGNGRVLPYVEKKQIKPATGNGSGFYPRVVWIPSRNRYAVGWSHYDYTDPANLDNGLYLSVLKPNMKFDVRPTKVMQQSMKNYPHLVSTLVPLEDRLLWGSSQDAKKKIRPVVWFTDYEGEIIQVPGARLDGTIRPGPKVKGGARVSAAHNRYLDQYLLTWRTTDQIGFSYQTYSDTYCRIMNGDGSFATARFKMPKKFLFHNDAEPFFNPFSNHYLVIYTEHKALSQTDPPASYIGGRIWATYIDSFGQLGVPGSPGQDAFPLTDVFTGDTTGMIFLQAVYNPMRNQYLIVFTVIDYQDIYNVKTQIWGMILKPN